MADPTHVQNLSMEHNGEIDFLVSQSTSAQLKLTSIETELLGIRSDHSSIKETNTKLCQDNSAIKQQLYSTQGKLAQILERHTKLHQRVIDCEYREMQKSLVFYNIPDQLKETPQTLKHMMYKLLYSDMGIPQDLIFQSTNPAADIRIDICHRIGKPNPKGGRPSILVLVRLMSSFDPFNCHNRL